MKLLTVKMFADQRAEDDADEREHHGREHQQGCM
jgi:hypothetical protein